MHNAVVLQAFRTPEKTRFASQLTTSPHRKMIALRSFINGEVTPQACIEKEDIPLSLAVCASRR